MTRVIELRAFRLKPGGYRRFHELVHSASVPLLRRFNVDVVSYGSSFVDSDGYYLVCSHSVATPMRHQEHAFCRSSEWLGGLRDEVLSLVEGHCAVTFEVDDETIDLMRSADFGAWGSTPALPSDADLVD